jgi:lipoate-protein ligase A
MSRERDERNLSTADIASASDAAQPRQDVREGDGQRREAANAAAQHEELAALFDHDRAEDFRLHWANIQTGFVDDPRRAVQQADELVAQVMKSLAESFSRQRQEIEAEVGGQQDADTENLRQALRRYRSFFERLLTL